MSTPLFALVEESTRDQRRRWQSLGLGSLVQVAGCAGLLFFGTPRTTPRRQEGSAYILLEPVKPAAMRLPARDSRVAHAPRTSLVARQVRAPLLTPPVPSHLRLPKAPALALPPRSFPPAGEVPPVPATLNALTTTRATPVRTGEFTAASPAASLGPPPREVQTGGFGNPDRSRAQAATITSNDTPAANLGTFDLPSHSSALGGPRGVPATVSSAGFGSGTLPRQRTLSAPVTVQEGGFGAANVPPAGKNSHATETAPDSTPVEILSKPSPIYTPEARRPKIEGEVLLAVVFQASGRVRVERVVKGLGHGLDEAAMAAAAGIRFRPAERDGLPFDFAATLHVVFQLAE